MAGKKRNVKRIATVLLADAMALSLVPMNTLNLEVGAQEGPVTADVSDTGDTEAFADESSPEPTEEANEEEYEEEPFEEEEPETEAAEPETPNEDSNAQSDPKQPETEEPDAQESEEPEEPEEGPIQSVYEYGTIDMGDVTSKELYTYYAESLLYSQGGISLLGLNASRRLSGNELLVYNQLKPMIQEVASGSRTSTIFTIDVSSGTLEFVKNSSGEYEITGFDMSLVLSALLADNPYELYWFDKTYGYYYGGSSDSGTHVGTMKFYFFVTDDFMGDDGFSVNAAKVSAAGNAAATAQAIVQKYASYSDADKLTAYKNEICALVSYDNSAAQEGVAYGDASQLINVFDNDASTNVVCEGYAKAFQYLCDLSDFDNVQCYTVSGTMNGGTGAGAHMWNIVRIGDRGYMVDLTNSDAGTIGQNGGLFLSLPASGSVDDGYTFKIGRTSIVYLYDEDQAPLWGTDILTLAQPSVTFTAQPADASVALGQSVTLTASAQAQDTGSSQVTYQWYTVDASGNKTAISGAQSSSYTITPDALGTTSYVCQATSGKTSAYSNTVSVTVSSNVKEISITSLSADGWTYGQSAGSVEFETNGNKDTAVITYKQAGADDSTYTSTVPSQAGDYVVKVTIPATSSSTKAEATASFTIAKKSLSASISGTTSKVYDGTTAATGLTVKLEGLVSGDSVAASASFAYASASAGTVLVNATGISLTGSAASNYTLVNTSASVQGTITKKELSASISGDASKVYDGTTAASGLTVKLEGLVSGDSVSASASFAYESADAGTVLVNATGIALTGSAASNYTLANTTASKQGTILQKEVTPALQGTASKVYDKTTAASGLSIALDGVLESDDVTAKAAFAYDSADAGSRSVLVQDIALSGKAAGNYKLSTTTLTGTGEITPKAIDPALTLSPQSCVYDGTAKTPEVTLKDGDTLIDKSTYSTSYSGNTNAGVAYVTVSSLSGNYTFNKTVPFAIEQASLKDALIVVNGTYTYNKTAQIPDITVSVNGKSLSENDYVVTASSNTNAGQATVTVTGTGNYKDSASAAFTIAKKVPEIQNVTTSQSLYASSDPASVVLSYESPDGVKGSVNLKEGTVFEEGTGEYEWTFTSFDANYASTEGTVSLNVEKDTLVSLEVQGQLARTSYEYTDTLDLSGLKIVAHFASGNTLDVTDSVSLPELKTGDTQAEVTYTNSGVSQSVVIEGISVSKKKLSAPAVAWNAGSYVYNQTLQGPQAQAEAAQGLVLNVTGNQQTDAGDYTALAAWSLAQGYSPENYEIEGTVTSSLNWSIAKADQAALAIAGKEGTIQSQDTFVLSVTGGSSQGSLAFEVISGPAQISKDGTVTVTGSGTVVIAVTKEGDANYNPVTAAYTFEARKAAQPAMSLSGPAQAVYGDAPIVLSVTGGLEGQSVSWSSQDPDVASVENGTVVLKKAGTVTITATKAGNDAYEDASASLTLTIAPKALTAALETGNFEKVYDGTTAAQTPLVKLEGAAEGDDVSVLASAQYNSADAGEKTVSVSLSSLEGADAANYILSTDTLEAAGVISPKPVTASVTVSDKYYDGTTSASVSVSLEGILDQDKEEVTPCAITAQFAQAQAGQSVAVTLSNDITLTGSKAQNYTIASQPEGLSANIKSYQAPAASYTSSHTGWTNEDVIIQAASGYAIALADASGQYQWQNEIPVQADEGTVLEGSLSIVVRNLATGAISDPVEVSYQIDKEAPQAPVITVSQAASRRTRALLDLASSGLYKNDVTVSLQAEDAASGLDHMEYLLSDTPLAVQQLEEAQGWTVYEGPVSVNAADQKTTYVYARAVDKAQNVSDTAQAAAEFDTQSPVIEGASDGQTYYVDTQVSVTDAHLGTVTLNGEEVSSSFVLEANTDTTATITAVDQAGNQTTITVNLKPVSQLAGSIASLDASSVTSENQSDIEALQKTLEAINTDAASTSQKEELQALSEKAQSLLDAIDQAQSQLDAVLETLGALSEQTITQDQQDTLSQAKESLEALSQSDNYTAQQKQEIQDALNTADKLAQRLEEANNAFIQEAIVQAQDIAADTVTLEDEDTLQKGLEALSQALDAYGNNLTEDQKAQNQALKAQMEEALNSIADVQKAAGLTAALPDAKDITVKDKETIEAAQAAYDALSDYEKSLLTNDEKTLLEEAQAALKKAQEQQAASQTNKEDKTGAAGSDTKKTSPATAIATGMMGWSAMFAASGAALARLLRKRKEQ